MTISYTMSNEAYHAAPAISSTAVKTVSQKSLAHWRYSVRKESPAFAFGTAAHTLVLEPHMQKSVWCGPETRRGNEWKERKKAADEAGATLLIESEYKQCSDLANAVRANKYAAQLLGGDMKVEASVFVRDEIYGLDLRTRPDAWRRDINALIDLKTTVDASPEGFAKSCAQFGYHIQEAFYRRCMELEGHSIDRFVFIAVEKEPPYAVGVYELDWATLDEGTSAMKDALEKISKARELNAYDTGFGELQTLRIPRWAFKYTTPEGV